MAIEASAPVLALILFDFAGGLGQRVDARPRPPPDLPSLAPENGKSSSVVGTGPRRETPTWAGRDQGRV